MIHNRSVERKYVRRGCAGARLSGAVGRSYTSGMSRTLRSFVAKVVLFVTLAACAGWGREGHIIIGEVAWRMLPVDAQDRCRALLDGQSLAEVGPWADTVRDEPKYKWTAPLHYMNLPRDADVVCPQRDCVGGRCVLGAILRFGHELQDVSRPATERAEALRFLVHFVEDVHQPLHVSYAEDRGGNDVFVTFLGRRTNLHDVWDTRLIQQAGLSDEQYADTLYREITPEQAKAWAAALPEQWANESWSLARRCAYVIPDDHVLGADYVKRCRPVVDQRLMMASVRLAIELQLRLVGPAALQLRLADTTVSVKPPTTQPTTQPTTRPTTQPASRPSGR